MLWAFKLQGCQRCGVRYPEIEMHLLHCHHRNSDRERQGGPWKHEGLQSRQAIFDELLKCEVLCVGCHEDEHRGGIDGYLEQLSLFTGTGQAWQVAA